MNSKRMNDEQAARERVIYDYLQSLEDGDIDGIIDALQQATYDAPLDQKLMDAHHAYFQDEQHQPGTLADADTHEMTALEPATLSSHGAGPSQSRRMRRPSPWLQALVAVLLIGLIVSSFLTLIALRRSGTSSPNTPTVTPTCQSYPLRQFNAQNHVTTATSLNALTAVTAISSNDAWAVGSSFNVPSAQPHRSTFIEHWDGRSWQIVPSPDSPDGNGLLAAVAAVSASDVWAVGSSTHGTTTQGSAPASNFKTLVEHWDGTRWRVVPSPNGADGSSSLNALVAISANNIWAAGSSGNRPLLEHWDGRAWRIVSFEGSGAPSGGPYSTVGYFTGMSASTANDIWVVGIGQHTSEKLMHGLVEHWNGRQWTSLPAPLQSSWLEGVSALSPHQVWVAGADMYGHPLIASWDGQQWQSTALPASLVKQGLSVLVLSAVSSQDVWAAGTISINDHAAHPLILHWNGKAWQQIPAPALQEASNLPYSVAWGIAVYGEHQIWIVGVESDSEEGYHSALILGQRTCP